MLNAEALNYQDKVITKKDLVKGQQLSQRHKLGPSMPKTKKKTSEKPKRVNRLGGDFDKELSLRVPSKRSSRNASISSAGKV